MTLYTADTPGGLPVTRIGDSATIPRAPVARSDLVAALTDEESHLAYTQQLRLRFVADPGLLAGNDDTRDLTFDALVSAGAGIERLLASPGGHQALAHKFTAVRLVPSDKPAVTLSGKTLLVGISPAAGAAGRASSRAVAYALGKLLSVPEPG
jgi:hypothetical protein